VTVEASEPVSGPSSERQSDALPVRQSACPVKRPSGRRGYLIPGLIAMAVLLAIGVALGAGDLDHRSTSGLHGSDVAQQLALAIQAQSGLHTPPDVTCPATEPVRQGFRFSCSITGNGSTRVVDVEETDGRGHLRWQLSQPGS
jgi:hypothetical protein